MCCYRLFPVVLCLVLLVSCGDDTVSEPELGADAGDADAVDSGAEPDPGGDADTADLGREAGFDLDDARGGGDTDALESEDPAPDRGPDGPRTCHLQATVETDGGDVLADARVGLTGPARAEAVTDENGRLGLDLVCGTYLVTLVSYRGASAGLPDIFLWTVDPDFDLGESATVVWTLETATLSGRVSDDDGVVVPDPVRVEVALEVGGTGVFNSTSVAPETGRYELIVLVWAGDPYEMTARVQGPGDDFGDSTLEVVVVDDQTVNFTLDRIRWCTWAGTIRTSEGTIMGRARFTIDGVADPKLELFGDGTFEARLPCEALTIRVDHTFSGDPQRPFLSRHLLSTPVLLVSDSENGLLIPVVGVSGNITTGDEAVSGVRVAARLDADGGLIEGGAVSDETGDFAFVVPPRVGAYSIVVSVPPGEGLVAPEPFERVIDEETDLDMDLDTVPVCQLSGWLRTDLETPLRSGALELDGETDSAFVEANGAGFFEVDLNCGEYEARLHAEAAPETPGFEGWLLDDRLDVSEDAVLDVDIETVAVTGNVLGWDAEPLEAVSIEASRESVRGLVTGVGLTDESGNYALRMLPSDTDDVSFDAVPPPSLTRVYGTVRGRLALIDDDRRVEFVLSEVPLCRIDGTFATSEDVPIPETGILLTGSRLDGEDFEERISSDEDGLLDAVIACGTYDAVAEYLRGPGAFDRLPYPLVADVPNGNNWMFGSDIDLTNDVSHDFELTVLRVSGRTETRRGEPIPGVSIEALAELSGGVVLWNRVRSDDDGIFAMPIVRATSATYTITATPDDESGYEPQSTSDRFLFDRELDFVW
jgi:hypothetical protein